MYWTCMLITVFLAWLLLHGNAHYVLCICRDGIKPSSSLQVLASTHVPAQVSPASQVPVPCCSTSTSTLKYQHLVPVLLSILCLLDESCFMLVVCPRAYHLVCLVHIFINKRHFYFSIYIIYLCIIEKVHWYFVRNSILKLLRIWVTVSLA